MTRDFDGLTHRRFDLLVIGGGIHGLFAAWDAASRGLAVALVDRGDFGGGLSFNHQRTLHGGLRVLQGGRIGRARAQILERRTWARLAPRLIRPLPFLMATGRPGPPRWMVGLGFRAYNLISRDRNDGVPPGLHLPDARLEPGDAVRRHLPGAGAGGGALWYDYQTVHPDRLTWSVALAAHAARAVLINHVEALGVRRRQGRVTHVRVRDLLTAVDAEVEASAILLAAGSRTSELRRAFGLSGGPPVVRAMNLLFAARASDPALAAPGPSGRMLTAVPWAGRLLVGTFQSDTAIDGSELHPPSDAVAACLREAAAAFPHLSLTPDRVRLVHHGLTPARVTSRGADLLPEAEVRDHAAEDAPNVVSIVGVKYTTARAVARQAVDRIERRLGRRPAPCRTDAGVLPYAGLDRGDGPLAEALLALQIRLDPDVHAHLVDWYGDEAAVVIRHAAARRQTDRLSPDHPVLAGEISYAIEHAQARRLGDAVLRRTPLGAAGHPGAGVLDLAAAVMAAELGWSAADVERERTDVERVYPARAGGAGRTDVATESGTP